MTTNIKITTNGNYVSEGVVRFAAAQQPVPAGLDKPVSFKVGPGSMKEWSTSVPHGLLANIELTEREATPDEIAALTAGGAAA